MALTKTLGPLVDSLEKRFAAIGPTLSPINCPHRWLVAYSQRRIDREEDQVLGRPAVGYTIMLRETI